MKVICAGLYKTGTKSIKEALETLGYDVWDFPEQLNLVNGGTEAWKHYLQASSHDCDTIRKMFVNCEAVTDGPAAVLSIEIASAFPESKVILSVRDNADEWYASYERNRNTLNLNMILRFLRLVSPTTRERFEIMRLLNDAIACGRFIDDTIVARTKLSPVLCKRFYRSHIAYVRSVIPEERLLVFNVKDGWEPLCSFLDKEIPDIPFPHSNRAAFNASLSGIYHHALQIAAKSLMQKVYVEIAVFLCFATFALLSLTVAFHLI